MSARFASRAAASVLSAGAFLLAATGCGSSQATLDPIAQAADVTTHSGGSQIAMRVAVDSPGLASPLRLDGTGEFNMARQEGELFFDLEGIPASLQAGLSGGKVNITELFKDGVLYMASPLFAGKLPGAAKWIKLDLKAIESSLGIDVQSLSSGESNPAQFLQYLRGSGGAVKAVSRETIRGVPTTRYEGAIDLEKAAEQIPASDRSKVRAAIKALIAQTGAGSIPVTVWADDHHLLRRMRMKLPVAAGGSSGGVSVDYEMFGFGVSPSVTAPSSAETFDATKLSLKGISAGG